MFSEGNLISMGPVPELRRLIATVDRDPTICRALLYIQEAHLNSQLPYEGTCCYSHILMTVDRGSEGLVKLPKAIAAVLVF